MIEVRRADERGATRLDWLDSRHTFSFGDYHDPGHMGFRSLRVINEDVVKPAKGFGTHPHRDMEIITYIIEGALEHKDSMGNGSLIRPGEIQRMSAGTGVFHSEFNPSADQPVHLLQIWILPARHGLEPTYEQRAFDADEMRGRLRLVAAPNGDNDAVRVHQDARMYAGRLGAGEAVRHVLASGRHGWLQLARGSVEINGVPLRQGDGAAASDEGLLAIRATGPAEVILFDLA